jgi:hypothetical protein
VNGGIQMFKVLMTSGAALALVIALALTQPAQPAQAVITENVITGAGAGVFPAGATFNGVQLAGATYGVGVQTNTDGSGKGDFEIQINGSSPIGLSQWITITGWITSGAVNTDGTVTLQGTATLDMGDGTVPVGNLSLIVNLSVTSVQVTVGGTVLQALPKSDGWIAIE